MLACKTVTMLKAVGVAIVLVTLYGLFKSHAIESCSKDKECSKADQKKPITLESQYKLDDEYKTLGEDEVPILIWWYDDVFPHNPNPKTLKIQCPLGPCFTSTERNLQRNKSTRAFLFYGTSFLADDLPLPRRKHHLWSLFHEESPKNNWIFSHEAAIQVFNHTATFRRESDYPLSTQFIVDPRDWPNQNYFVPTPEKNRLQGEEKLAPIVYVQRDCFPPSDRDSYVSELMKYIQVDSYGPCLNNKKMPTEIKGFHKLQDEAYFKFLAKYKFHLSFENAICQDYMTEKLFRPLEIGVVPVYRGSPNVSDFMPTSKSIVIADNFKSPKELAKFLLKLNKDNEEYESYLVHMYSGVSNKILKDQLELRKWKINSKWDRPNFGHHMYAHFECDVCDLLYSRDEQIKNHLRNPKNPFPPPKYGQFKHMGCPEPIPAVENTKTLNFSVNYWEGFYEAKALREMLLAQEKDSKQFKTKYLRRSTDKYPR